MAGGFALRKKRPLELGSLDLLIDATVEADTELGYGRPRPVWPTPPAPAAAAGRLGPGARHLLILGIPGSGTTTTLSTIALTLADTYAPDELDLLVLALGTRGQQVRFLKHIRAELERRRATPGPHGRTVILMDGLGVLKDEYDDFEGLKLPEGLYRVSRCS